MIREPLEIVEELETELSKHGYLYDSSKVKRLIAELKAALQSE
jgi:hypothetical protein